MPADSGARDALLCPGCARRHSAPERFCEGCGMPLIHDEQAAAAQPPADERQQRIRKIKPQLAEGALVRVAGARNQAEAEFIQALLLEEGVPSLLRRSAGFDVPDFLAAGPRDVLVPQSGLATARDVLLEAELLRPNAEAGRAVEPRKLLLGLLIALALGALVVWGLDALLAR